jgi:hypothetical protein
MTAWTRATTVAHTLADRYNLERWTQRNIAYGLGARADLYALAASSTPDDRELLDQVVEQAQEYARARSGANLGIALHRITERIDRDEQLDVPDPWRPDVDSYYQTLADHRVRVHPEWIERIVVLPQLQVAGTLDRLVTIDPDITLTVADLKTGAEAPKYVNETVMQLALYANATHVWKGTAADVERDRYSRYLLPDPAEEPDAYDPMPTVNTDTALLIHLPVGEGACGLYEIDIKAGKEAVRLAIAVREWRKRKDLAWPLNPAPFRGGSQAADDW